MESLDSGYASSLSPSTSVLCLPEIAYRDWGGSALSIWSGLLFQGKFSQCEEAVRPVVRPLAETLATRLSFLSLPYQGLFLKEGGPLICIFLLQLLLELILWVIASEESPGQAAGVLELQPALSLMLWSALFLPSSHCSLQGIHTPKLKGCAFHLLAELG